MIEHAKFNQLLFGSTLRPRRRSRFSRQMQSHSSLISDAIRNRPLKFCRKRQHRPKHLADGSEIVIGDPLSQFQKLFIKHGREIKRFNNFFYLGSFNLRRTIMHFDDNARQALLPKRHQHTPAYNRLHAWRNGVGERHVKRHGEGDVAEEGHVEDVNEILPHPSILLLDSSIASR